MAREREGEAIYERRGGIRPNIEGRPASRGAPPPEDRDSARWPHRREEPLMNAQSLAERVESAKAVHVGAEAIRDIVVGIWNEKQLAGVTPALAGTNPGYPIHTVGGVTLFASPCELPAGACETYGRDADRDVAATGIAYFFVDIRWKLVESFVASHRPGRPRKSTFEEFAREHGEHLKGIEPPRPDMRI